MRVLNTVLRRARHRDRSLGQGLVEFALVVPLLLLLLLIAIDFGRAFYGWVVLQNSARIAANYAALNAQADPWNTNTANVLQDYQDLVHSDLDGANCELTDSAGSPTTTVPEPVFTDGADTSAFGQTPDTSHDVGDSVSVSLTCNFRPLTPLIQAFFNPLELGASTEFRIRAGDIAGLAHPTQIPPPVIPTPTPTVAPTPTPATPVPCVINADFDRVPTGGNITNGQNVTFTDLSTATGCTIVSYAWTFQLGNPATANTVGPHVVQFTVPSQQDVTVTLDITSSTGSTDSFDMTFRVRP